MIAWDEEGCTNTPSSYIIIWPMMAKLTGARFIAETLKAYGVSTVFYVPAILKGGLMEMERLGIRRVLCHSEKAAAYMADGYARACRRPGVAMSQSVGAANLAAGLQDAYLALSPVIAITGRQTPLRRYRNAYQEIDHWQLYEPVTKYNAYVDTIEQLPQALRQAFREATSGAPRPVHLELSGFQGADVAEAEMDLEVIAEEPFMQYPAFRPEPEPARVRQAARLLVDAQRPVLVAGGGAVSSQAGPEIVQLAEMMSIPVATSLNGKGAIPDNHPLSVGVVGTYSHWCANQVVQEADLVLFIGSHTGDQVTDVWTAPEMGTAVVQIDVEPSELGRNYPNRVALLGDAKVTVARLLEALEPLGSEREFTAHARELVSRWRREYRPLLTSDSTPVRPERICKEISEFLPSDAILVSDTGHATGWTGTMVSLTELAQRYIRCAGSLGWGFPGALGAKCASPERPVVCFTGDGGFWYHLSELETAARCGINTVTVVNNNRSLNQDKPGVDRVYRGNTTGNPEQMWMFRDINFATVAEAMGCFGIRVERPAEIRPALEEALASGRPAVVDVATDIEAFAPWSRKPQ